MDNEDGSTGSGLTRSQLIYGDASLDEWVAQGDEDPGEPWRAFGAMALP